jgi:uncharacterized membrane protein
MTGNQIVAQQTIVSTSHAIETPEYRKYLPLLVALAALTGFLAAPWPFAEKAHAVLHGLCAQTPSHTILLGGQPLPFDARMTGIYSGLAVVMAVTGLRTRFRAAGIPAWPVLATLALLVVIMAVDGFNSLFLDLGMRHLYEPQNWLRLITGAGAGAALGATMLYLLGATVWERPGTSPVLSWRDLAFTAALWAVVAGLFFSGWGWLYPIMSFALVIAAVGTICVIAYLMLTLTRMTNNRHQSFADLGAEGAAGILIGLLAVALLAGGRFALESWLGIPAPR